MKHGFLKIQFVVLGLQLLFVIPLRSAEPPPPPVIEKGKGTNNVPTTSSPRETEGSDDIAPLPLRGATGYTVVGGTRGSGVSLTCLTVLAPDSIALTVQEQPSLFWYQSLPEDVRFELTILVNNTIQPLLQVQLPGPRKAGIQRLNLADHNVKLVSGVEYEWVVALVVDSTNRSEDVISSGWIKRVDPSSSLKSQVDSAKKKSLPSIYGGEGIWLDTLTAISDLIEDQPKDRSLQERRAALLAQWGLTNAAAYAASQAVSDHE